LQDREQRRLVGFGDQGTQHRGASAEQALVAGFGGEDVELPAQSVGPGFRVLFDESGGGECFSQTKSRHHG